MEKLNQNYEQIKEWWFYDLQNVLDAYSKILERRNEEEQKQAKAQGYDPKKNTPKEMMNSARGMMPKIGNGIPGMPKMTFPK